jgi:hypothetical protein
MSNAPPPGHSIARIAAQRSRVIGAGVIDGAQLCHALSEER